MTLITIAAIIIAVMIFLYFVPINIWITAVFSGINIDLMQLIFMRIRRVPPQKVVFPLITLKKSGVAIEMHKLETHYLAGGNVDKVANALAIAHNKNLDLSWEHLAGKDLKKEDVILYVQNYQPERAGDLIELREKLAEIITSQLSADQVREVGQLISTMGKG